MQVMCCRIAFVDGGDDGKRRWVGNRVTVTCNLHCTACTDTFLARQRIRLQMVNGDQLATDILDAMQELVRQMSRSQVSMSAIVVDAN